MYVPGVGDGDGGHELRQALLELDADALGADRAPPRTAATASGRFERVLVIVVFPALLTHLENLSRHHGYHNDDVTIVHTKDTV